MNIHEYQAKELLKQRGVTVPVGIMIEKAEEARAAAQKVKEMTNCDVWVIKAQIHSGGRGKAGGVKIANSLDEVCEIARQMLGMQLFTRQTGPEGKTVHKLLIEQGIYYAGNKPVKEWYFSIVLNRSKERYEIIYSQKGGMDIETVAAQTPSSIYQEIINPNTGLLPFQARKIAFMLGTSLQGQKELISCILNLYSAFVELDASLLEINPLVNTSDDHFYAADVKLVIDDNALFRHSQLKSLRDLEEEDPFEAEASEYGLNFIKLNGNIGCMVNGAGLAMATMDMIKLVGGEPANFLDIGGDADAKKVEAGFRIILKDKNVKAILINIFGGIVRCDRVAEGILEAYHNIQSVHVPIIIRLQGTFATEGKQLLDKSGLKVYSATTIDEAAYMLKQLIL
jgi:succinyl-CoA synthetase beta subunit